MEVDNVPEIGKVHVDGVGASVPVQCRVLGVVEQRDFHNPKSKFGKSIQIVMTNPRNVENCPFVL